MKYVNESGDIFKMSDAKYREYLKAGAAGVSPCVDAYGTRVLTTDFNATRGDTADFRDALEQLDYNKKANASERTGRGSR